MDNTLIELIIIASSLIGYFLSIALVASPFYKSHANNYLSFSLFLLATLSVIGWNDAQYGILELLSNFTLELLFPVTLFTYFLIHLKHKYLKRKWFRWLYIPFILSVIIEIAVIVLKFGFEFYSQTLDDIIFDIKDVFAITYNILLIIYARRLIKKSETISDTKKHWLLCLNFFILCIISVWLLSNIELYIFNSEYITNLMWLLLSTLLWWVLYYGVFKLQLVVQKDEIHNYLDSEKIASDSTKTNTDYNELSEIITKLYILMDEAELYKNPLLSRLDLAKKLGVSEGHLSKIVNQELNKSIIQFVNDYRVESAKRLLHNPVFNKYSVEAIGMESGFKSKSAFYSAFKNSLHISPGAYRKQNKTS